MPKVPLIKLIMKKLAKKTLPKVAEIIISKNQTALKVVSLLNIISSLLVSLKFSS